MQKLGRNVEVLKGCGTNEDKIGDAITAAQRATFERLKINPDKGIYQSIDFDLSTTTLHHRIRSVRFWIVVSFAAKPARIGMANLKLIVRDFKSDPEIINVFGAMLQMEEMITVVTISRNGGKQVQNCVAKEVFLLRQYSHAHT
jgi:hypothetical protein